MKYKVIKRYNDSELKKVLNPSDIIEINNAQRADQLIRAGLIEQIGEAEPVKKKRGRKPKK